MPDSNYLIEILLAAKDEASAKIAALKRDVQELKAEAAGKDLSQGLRDMGAEAERASKAHQELNRQQQESRRSTQQSQSDIKRVAQWQQEASQAATGHAESIAEVRRQQSLMPQDAAKAESATKRVTQHHEAAAESVAAHAASHEDLSSNLEDSGKKLDQLVPKARNVEGAIAGVAQESENASNAQQKLAEKADKALGTFDELRNSFQAGSGDLKQLRQDLEASSQELSGLARRFQGLKGTLDEDARMFRDIGEEASSMAKSINTLQTSSRQPISASLGLDKARQDLSSLTRDFERFRAVQASQEREQAQITSRLFASRFGSLARAFPTSSPEFQRTIDQQIAAKAIATPAKETKAPRDLVAEGDTLIVKMRQLDQAARQHVASNAELREGYSQLASGFRKVWREMDVGSNEARKFGRAMDDAGQKAKNLDLARAAPGAATFFQKLGAATDGLGVKIVSLSAELRGIRLAALIGLVQPLDTALVGLAGGFFNIASGAAQAAASIGGVFISGLGQMIPMVSVGIAALLRLRDIFQAVSAAQQARQQAFFQPNQGIITQLQNTQNLIQTEENLTNAYYGLHDAQVQVRQSQIALTQARIDAVRNITDLTLAEKSAQLQLKGANLSIVQAQEQERAAQASGDQMAIAQARLQLQQAQLSQRQAQIGVPRSQQNLRLALSYGVTGAPNVLSATEAARQAGLGVIRAQQQISNAQRQLRIEQLTLAQPASHMSQPQATLQYLLSQMSGPEKALFNVLNNFETQLRSPNSPLKKITDAIVSPFTVALQRIQVLLRDPKFMAPINALAKAMGSALGAIEKTMFGSRGTSFFETMATDATKSLPIVVSAITGLMHVFQDIAKAAAPAFRRLSDDWARFWNAMDRRDSSPQGQARLTKFFNQGAKWAEDFARLAGAIFNLFKALGHDAAPQGMKSVTDFTQSIQGATNWVKTHGPEVTKFFSDARQALGLLGDIISTIGKMMLGLFNIGSLRIFASVVDTIVLPAAQNLAKAIGFLVTNTLKFFTMLPGGKNLLIGLATGFLGLLAINKLVGVFSRVHDAIRTAHKAWDAFKLAYTAFKFGGFGAAVDALKNGLSGKVDGSQMITAAEKFQVAANTFDKAADKVVEASAEQNTASDKEVAAGAEQQAAATEEVAAGAEMDAAGAEMAAGGAAAAGGGAAAATGGGAAGLGIAGLGTAAAYAGPVVLAGLLSSRTSSQQALSAAGPLTKYLTPQQTQDLMKQLGSQSGTGNAKIGNLPWGPDTVKLVHQADAALKQYASTGNVAGLEAVRKKAAELAKQWPANKQAMNDMITVMNQAQQQAMPAMARSAQTNFQMVANAVLGAMQKGVNSVVGGMNAINKMLSNALKALGVNISPNLVGIIGVQGAISLGQAAAVGGTGATSSQGLSSSGGSGHGTGFATGGWHRASPGGRIAQVAEGGHDEVTLTTDPRHASRQRMLLSQYMSRMPHMASGGFPGGNYVFPYSPGMTQGRTDMGLDWLGAGNIGAIGQGKVTLVIPQGRNTGWPGAGGGGSGAFITYQLLAGPDAGRYVYLAENVDPLVRQDQTVAAGQAIAHARGFYPFTEMGWAAGPGQTTLAQASGNTGGAGHSNSPAGIDFTRFVLGLAHGKITGGALGALGTVIPHLTAPKIKLGGVLGGVGQGILNKVTSAANQYLMAHAPTTSASGVGSIPSTSGPVLAQIYQVLSAAGLNKIGAAGIIGNALQESGWSPSSVGSGGGGLWGFTSSPMSLADLQRFAAGKNRSWTDAAVQTAFLLMNLSQSARAALNAQKTPAAAADWFMSNWERPAVATENAARREAGANQAFARGYAVGGQVAPWGGRPVPIIAHENERIVNPMQWNEVGRLTGMGAHGLDAHLGYNTGRPRQHFDLGGPVLLGSQSQAVSHGPVTPASLAAINQLLTGLTTNLFKSDPGSLSGALGVLSHVFQSVVQGFNAIGRLGGSHTSSQLSKLDNLVNSLDNTTDGALTMLAAAFQRFQNNLANWITNLSFRLRSVDPRRVARIHGRRVTGSGFAGVRIGGSLTARNIGETGTASQDLLNERSLVEQGDFLGTEERAVTAALHSIRRDIQHVRHSHLSRSAKKSALSKLESNYTDLVQQQETLANAMNQNITSRFQAEQQYIQDTLTQVGDVFQTQQARIQSRQSIAQSYGRYRQMPSLDRALANSAAAQLKALQPILRHAQKIGDHDLVAQIQQSMMQLRSTIAQSTAQMIQDSMSAVQQTAQTQQAQVSMQQTIAQSLYSNAATPGEFAQAGALTAKALQTNQSSIQGQLSSYNALLSQAQAQGNTGAVATLTQTIDQLTAQLVQNQQALSDNTAQMVSQASQFIQSRGQFSTGLLGGLGSIIQTIGQTTGFTDVATLKGLVQNSNASISTTNSGLLGQLAQLGSGASPLAALLGTASTPEDFVSKLSGANLQGIESGHDSTWISTFEGIVNALEQNTQQTAQNNQQLAQLNGQLLQPQSWSTSTWSAFRSAVFSGMGNLLPQYQQTLSGSAIPTIAPTFSPVSHSGTPTIGVLNVTHPVQQWDPQLIGEQIHFELSTLPG